MAKDTVWKKQDGYAQQGEWKGTSFYRAIGGKWVVQDAVKIEPTPANYLTFSSAESFTIATSNATKNWDGTLYYSTDTETWSEWDGTTVASDEHGGEQRVYVRGSGNSIITGGAYASRWVLTGNTISCNGNIENLLDYEIVANGEHPTMAESCYYYMFYNCTNLISAPKLPATTLADSCYRAMFQYCKNLVSAPELPATTLSSDCYNIMFHRCTSLISVPKLPAITLEDGCYSEMFYDCSNIKLSTSQTGEYQTAYRIPTSGTGTSANSVVKDMFTNTGGTFTGTPEINTTYYTSNTVV